MRSWSTYGVLSLANNSVAGESLSGAAVAETIGCVHARLAEVLLIPIVHASAVVACLGAGANRVRIVMPLCKLATGSFFRGDVARSAIARTRRIAAEPIRALSIDTVDSVHARRSVLTLQRARTTAVNRDLIVVLQAIEAADAFARGTEVIRTVSVVLAIFPIQTLAGAGSATVNISLVPVLRHVGAAHARGLLIARRPRRAVRVYGAHHARLRRVAELESTRARRADGRGGLPWRAIRAVPVGAIEGVVRNIRIINEQLYLSATIADRRHAIARHIFGRLGSDDFRPDEHVVVFARHVLLTG
jgi:hypothetical protein